MRFRNLLPSSLRSPSMLFVWSVNADQTQIGTDPGGSRQSPHWRRFCLFPIPRKLLDPPENCHWTPNLLSGHFIRNVALILPSFHTCYSYGVHSKRGRSGGGGGGVQAFPIPFGEDCVDLPLILLNLTGPRRPWGEEKQPQARFQTSN